MQYHIHHSRVCLEYRDSFVGHVLGRNHTDGSQLTPLCHDWCVSCPNSITTHRCESLPPNVVTPLDDNDYICKLHVSLRTSLTNIQSDACLNVITFE